MEKEVNLPHPVPSIATKRFLIGVVILSLYHYMFRTPRAILRWIQYTTLFINVLETLSLPQRIRCFKYVYITQQDAPHWDKATVLIITTTSKREYGRLDPLRWPRDTLYQQNVGTKFINKRRSLGRYSLLAE
jgi:hypothetical protein